MVKELSVISSVGLAFLAGGEQQRIWLISGHVVSLWAWLQWLLLECWGCEGEFDEEDPAARHSQLENLLLVHLWFGVASQKTSCEKQPNQCGSDVTVQQVGFWKLQGETLLKARQSDAQEYGDKHEQH